MREPTAVEGEAVVEAGVEVAVAAEVVAEAGVEVVAEGVPAVAVVP